MSGNESVLRHKGVAEELNALYERKNHDYGDSFHLTWEKFGAVMAAIRLEDKLQRFETLIRAESKVHDESIRDTLMDLANYSIMSVMELDREAEARRTVVEEEVTVETGDKSWFKEMMDAAAQSVENLNATLEQNKEDPHVCEYCIYCHTVIDRNGKPCGLECYKHPFNRPKVKEDSTCGDWRPEAD